MKTLPILLSIFTLFFTLVFSSISSAEWTVVDKTIDGGDTFYVDFDRIRKQDGYVYYWVLGDYLKPTEYGDSSHIHYYQGDCKLFRFKTLSDSYFKGQMGKGKITYSSNEPDKKWTYPDPISIGQTLLTLVCNW